MIKERNERPESKARRVAKTLARLADSKAGTLLICLLFSLFLIYHYVIPFNAILSRNGMPADDPAHSIWTLWLVNENVTRGQSPYHTDLIFYPVGADLTHHTLSPGFFPVTFLVKQLSGGDPMYPVYAYRIIVWLCFTLLLYFTWLLLRRLEFSRWAAAIGAIGFAFCDFFIEHAAHVSLLSAFFIPLTGLLLLRLYRKPGAGAALATALAMGLAIYFTELALYIFLGLFFVVAAMCLRGAERQALFEKARRLGWRHTLLAIGICLTVMTPFVIQHFSSDTTRPQAFESANFSANLPGLIIPEPQRTPLYGNVFEKLSARMTKGIGGREVFAGFLLLTFAAIGLVVSKQRMVRVVGLVSLVFIVLSLGPTLKVFGADTGWPMPYALLMKVPPFDLGRTPVRFAMMGIFFLAIAAAAGITWTQHALKSRIGSGGSWAAMLVILTWATAEAHAPLPRQPSFSAPAELARLGPGPVLNLPASRFDGYASLLQIFHKQPIATGYISRSSRQQIDHVERLAALADRDGSESCAELMKLGMRNLIINPVPVAEAPYEFSGCQMNVVDLRRKNIAFAVYNLGMRIDFSQPAANQFLGYGWSVPEPVSRWSDRGKAVVAFQIAATGPAILRLKLAPFLVSGKLDRQRLSIAVNDQVLAVLTLDKGEAQEYSIPVPANALRAQNLLTLVLRDAESPKNLGLSEDTRRLGINVHWLEIYPAAR